MKHMVQYVLLGVALVGAVSSLVTGNYQTLGWAALALLQTAHLIILKRQA
jgi:hypothetical protein